MPRPAVTKGEVERAVKGAIAGGLRPGTFEVRIEGATIRLIPVAHLKVHDDALDEEIERHIARHSIS